MAVGSHIGTEQDFALGNDPLCEWTGEMALGQDEGGGRAVGLVSGGIFGLKPQ